MFIRFILFHFLGIIVEAYYFEQFITPLISDDEGWLIKNPYNGASVHTYDCGGNIIFGGYQIFGCYSSTQTSIIKYFLLPPHNKVTVDITFWKIDDWPISQRFYIIIDQWTQGWYFSTTTGSSLCAGSGVDYTSYIDNDFSHHTLNSAVVELYSECSNTNFWGLTNFIITLQECYQGCQFCLDSSQDCIMWILWQSFFSHQNLDLGLEGWIKNKFPSFTYQTNELQIKMLVLNQYDSAITYLTLPDHTSLIIQFRIEYLSGLPLAVGIYINDQWKFGLNSQKKNVDYRSDIINDNSNKIKIEIYSADGAVSIREISVILRGPINLIQCVDDNLVPFDGCFAKQESCLDGCTFCVKGECLMCDTKWDYNSLNKNCEPLCGDKLITGNEQCDDGNDYPQDGCHECKFSCPVNCKYCLFGQCQICESGYYYSNGLCNRNYDKLAQDEIQVDNNQFQNSLVQTDIAICGDSKIQQDEQCDDGNNIPNDGCYNCYFQCILNCNECYFGVCQHCSQTYELIDGKCLDLQTQFRYISCIRSVVNQNQISDQNNDICCDDTDIHCNFGTQRIENSNIIFQCPQYCDICEYGKCKKCQINYFLLNNMCISQITRGKLVFKDELNLNLIEIGCYKCNDSCQIECLSCLNSFCLLCIEGWSLINGICQQICGDNQVALFSKEQCDSNLNDCLNCRYVCPENCQICVDSKECLICDESFVEINHECQKACQKECKKCINGVCHDNCLNGEMKIDGICYSICGDGIKQQKEQCDDGNNIQFDGCFNCEYSCPLYCVNCEEGICYECQKYFQLIQNVCYDDCGSGIKSFSEQCDDNNILNLDGCSSNCEIELDYKCNDNILNQTECQYFESPNMIVQFLYQNYNKYYIEISFSQAISFRDNYDLKSLFDFSFEQLNSKDFTVNLQSNYKPVINQILDFQFEVEIEFLSSTNSSLIKLTIDLMNEAFNQYEMELINPSREIFLKQNIKLSQSDIEKTKQLTQYQEAMILAQGIGSIIVLVSGNFQIFIAILDNLQYQSYLKYTNIIYPENLFLFFESTNLIGITPILNFLQFTQFYEMFIFSDFIESYAKLKFYNLNAHLITNLQFFIIQVISTFIFVISLKFICQIIFTLIYKIQFQHILVFQLRNLKSKLLIKTLKWIYIFFRFIMIFVYQFFQDGTEGLLLANTWDVLFKTFLYLESSTNQDTISRIQTAISYLILGITMKFIISSLKKGFNRKDQNLNYRYKAVYLLKQFFFCYFLICFQNHSLIQLLMLTTTNIIYLCLLIFVEFNLEKLDKVQIIILETSIIIFTMTSIFHLKDYNFLISGENQITLGFAQIYLLISGLLGVFLKQIIMIFYQIKHICHQYRKKKRISKRVTHLLFESVL